MVLDEQQETQPTSNAGSGLTPDELAKVRYDKRWELLKPVLEPLFFRDKYTLKQLSEAMRYQYRFQANEIQYKYHFKKWKWKRNIPNAKKVQMCQTLQARVDMGKTSSSIQYRGGAVEKKKLVRFMKSDMKQTVSNVGSTGFSWPGQPLDAQLVALEGRSAFLPNNIFLNWNIPHNLLQLARSSHGVPSPMSPNSHSSPNEIAALTPGSVDHRSPTDAPSPLTVSLGERQLLERSRLFVTGQHRALANTLETNEQERLSRWMYEYWFYLYKTAKHWGYGPTEWTAEKLNISTFVARTPISDGESAASRPLPSPPLLCRWSVHVQESAILRCSDFEFEDDSSGDPSDLTDSRSWKLWPKSGGATSFPDKVTEGLASNLFSTIKKDALPIALDPVIKAAESSKQQIGVESLSFAIISGNYKLVEDAAEKVLLGKTDLPNFYPLHMAAAYLDGAKSCCLVFYAVKESFHPKFWRSRDQFGHTVLDTLILRILGSHSTLHPGKINNSMRASKGFEGDAIDICGRWDLESECYQALKAGGKSAIPAAWKHKFCNTSVQAICHCIRAHFYFENMLIGSRTIKELILALPVNQTSGLFTTYCKSCGLKMELKPLHMLVMVGFHLAESGMVQEDLFGVIVVLMQLLVLGADAGAYCHIDPTTLFGIEDASNLSSCNHHLLTAADLAMSVPATSFEIWSRSKGNSWEILRTILQMSQSWAKYRDSREETLRDHNPLEDDSSSEESLENHDPLENSSTEDLEPLEDLSHYCDSLDHEGVIGFSARGPLGLLHAILQTEILTYRRQNESDPWQSDRIDLEEILQQLRRGQLSPGRLKECGLRAVCGCGEFINAEFVPTAEDATDSYISNLGDQWPLLNALPCPRGNW